MLLDPDDPLSEPIPLKQAADRASVSPRTVRRWLEAGQLKLMENMPGEWVLVRDLLACERDRYVAAHAGRPGPRVSGLTT